MFASSLASAIILRKRAPLRGGSDTCYLGKAAGGENWRPQGYSLLIFCLTHTVTHTGKRADGNNGVNRSRPHPFWRKKHRKALHGKGWKAFKHLVRMRSAVQIGSAAPATKNRLIGLNACFTVLFCIFYRFRFYMCLARRSRNCRVIAV